MYNLILIQGLKLDTRISTFLINSNNITKKDLDRINNWWN